MTIENSEETAQLGVIDPAEKPGLEPSSSSTDSVQDAAPRVESPSGVIETAPAAGTHDSSPPFSRKLAPPPKPKRESGAASAPPSARPGEGPDLVASASALKAPIAPTISFAGAPTLESPPAVTSESSPEIVPPPIAPLSQPPPMRRRSNPSFSELGAPNVPPVATPPSVRMPSDPALVAGDAPAAKETSVAPRPIATPPRPRSDPPGPRLRADSSPSVPDAPAPSAPASAAVPSSASPSSPPGFPAPSASQSAIFAMRIIAVGDSARPPTAQEPTTDADSSTLAPNASRLGTGVRRSSRPAPAPIASPVAAPSPVAEPAASAPAASAPAASASEASVPAADSSAVAPAAASPALASVPFMVPPAPPMPTDIGPSIEIDVPIDVELPAKVPAADTIAALDAAAAALEASSVEAPSAPLASPSPEKRRPPAPPPPVELSDDQFSAEAIHKKIAAAEAAEAAAAALAAKGAAEGSPPVEAPAPVEPAPAAEVSAPAEAAAPGDAAEELGREDAISMPPEEVAVEDAVKPPPPPKRAAAAAPAPAPALATVVESAPPSAPPAPPKEPPPTPDPAAAKAAQRAKTRQPWWEDLFNEDFMRASARVSDESIRREVTFIEESLGVAAGGVVLDLGCGAGHHAVEFASRGYGVVGYDLSLYQLALAADVAQERSQKINFLQGDMREMAFEEMFDGVFCWNTTFGYFEEDKNLAVAQRVFKALRPGGMFLIDVINRDFAAASAPCTVWYEGDSCVCMDDMSVDYISSRLRVKRSIILDDGRTKESLFSLRLYSLHELGKLLHEVGFRVTEASGHPATPGVFFGPNSPRIIMLAQRP